MHILQHRDAPSPVMRFSIVMYPFMFGSFLQGYICQKIMSELRQVC